MELFKNFDHAEKIHALTMVIKSICEENNISKNLVIDDFIYIIGKNEKAEDAKN